MMVDITGDDDEDDAVAESNCLAADATADSHTMVGNIMIISEQTGASFLLSPPVHFA